jgi:hypothetical protein
MEALSALEDEDGDIVDNGASASPVAALPRIFSSTVDDFFSNSSILVTDLPDLVIGNIDTHHVWNSCYCSRS